MVFFLPFLLYSLNFGFTHPFVHIFRFVVLFVCVSVVSIHVNECVCVFNHVNERVFVFPSFAVFVVVLHAQEMGLVSFILLAALGGYTVGDYWRLFDNLYDISV